MGYKSLNRIRMDFYRHIENLFIFICSIFILVGCNSNEASVRDKSLAEVDSLVVAYRDSMLCRPVATRQVLLDARKDVQDSVSYYKLSLFVGFCLFHENKIDSALYYYNSTLDFCKRQDPSLPHLNELKAFACNYLGVMHLELGDRSSSLLFLKQAYDALQQASDKRELPDVCINLADNYQQSGNFAEATSCYRRALIVADSLNMGHSLDHVIYCGLGRIYAGLNNFALSDHYYRLGEQYFNQITPYEQYYFANTRGNYYYITKEYKKALQWFYKANKATRGFKHGLYSAVTEANLGEVYLLLNQTDSAQHYLDEAGAFFLTPGADPSTTFYMNGLYASLALQKNDLAKAESYLSKPFKSSEINPTYVYLREKRLTEFYEKKGDFRNAYLSRRNTDLYDDSVRNITTLNNIAEIDSRYRQDTTLLKRDVVIAESKTELFQFRVISLILGIVLVTIVMTGIALSIHLKRKREQRYAKQVATIIKLRMENVRNRISPHYIFNVLNVVMPALRQYDELTRPLHLLIQSIRNNLLVSEKMKISLQQEVDFVKTYLELKNSINPQFPQVIWDVEEGVNMETQVPSMIMQIPVENAVKYAFDSSSEPDENKITITISQKDKTLNITIEDNGIGFEPGRFADTGKGTGTGLKVMFRTMDILNAKNLQKMSMEIKNLEDVSAELHGTKVAIVIPLNYNYKL